MTNKLSRLGTRIFLHPVGLDANCWVGAAKGLSGIRLDLPGHGRRRDEAVPDSLPRFADDVLQQVEGDLHLVGASLGGMIALHAALQAPERVRSLVVAVSAAALDSEAMLSRAVKVRDHGTSSSLDETLERWFSPSFLRRSNRPELDYVRQAFSENDDQKIAATWQAMAGYDLREQLVRIECPITVVIARQDRSIPVAAAQLLVDELPIVRAVEIDGPHMLILEKPTQFRNIILEHFKHLGSLQTISTHDGGSAL